VADAASGSQVGAAIAASAQTRDSVSLGDVDVHVAGIGGVPFVGYDGDSTWLGYELIQGRWFAAAGEAVAPTNLFTQTGLHVGDRTTLIGPSGQTTVTLVGEILDQSRENGSDLVIRGQWADLQRLSEGASPTDWEAAPIAGIDPGQYASTIRAAVGPAVSVEEVRDAAFNESFQLFRTVIALLGFVLVAISVGGVVNTVLLETRRRTRETAILKSIGMSPAQVLQMVIASVVPIGLVSGIVGVPVGLLFQRVVLGFMGHAAIGTNIPEKMFDVFPIAALIGLGLVGVAIAVAGAYLPAQRAALARIAPVLQAE
jgi:putative ABC transport system permease protein